MEPSAYSGALLKLTIKPGPSKFFVSLPYTHNPFPIGYTYDRKSRCVVGVHMAGSYVSEIIYGAAMMVQSRLPVQHLDKIVFPHPTVGEVVREALFML